MDPGICRCDCNNISRLDSLKTFNRYLTPFTNSAAISEYDQVLAEDGTTNRLLEARNLFKTILQTDVLQKTKFILFLNKADIFKDKMKKGNIKKYITRYTGNVNNVDDATKYIEKDIFKKVMTDYQQ